jgi:hypothetical protein
MILEHRCTAWQEFPGIRHKATDSKHEGVMEAAGRFQRPQETGDLFQKVRQTWTLVMLQHVTTCYNIMP